MVVCKFYIQGSCKFGDRCRNEHPRNLNDINRGNQNYGFASNYNRGGQTAYNTGYSNNYGNNQRYGNYGGGQRQQQDQFHWRSGQQSGGGRDQAGTGKSVSFHNSFGGSNQNRFSALDPGGGGAAQKTDGQDLKPNEIIDIIKKDIEEWEGTKMWPLSCYKPTRSQHCVPGFEDIIQEELRYAAYIAEKQQKFEQYKAAVTSLMATVQQQKDQLKRPSSDLSSQLVDIFKGIFQAGSSTSLGNGDTMFQALVTASGGNNTQPAATASTQQATPFGSASATTAPATSSFGGSNTSSSGFSFAAAAAQGAGSTSGFGSGSFGKTATSGGFAAGASGGFGSSGTGFGSIAGGTGLFGKSGSTPGSAQPGTGLFGKGAATAGAASTTSGTGLFGKGGSTPTNTGLFGKPVAAGGGIFSQGQSGGAVDSNTYTPIGELTAEEKEQFEADVFTIGKIPTRPPPAELVR